MRLVLAWGVHLFTACGAVVGALALYFIAQGAQQLPLLLMLVAMAIDSVDGMMARAVGVSRLTPQFDGRRLDDITDFLNFVIVPVVFLVATGLLPHWAWAAPPILASAYGFSLVEAKTEDDYFLGWPSYWNVVAIYAWLLELSPLACTAFVTLFSLLVFVPFKYIYPTRLRAWKRTTYVLCAAAGALIFAALLDPELGRSLHLVELSLVFPAWYLLLSLRLGGLHRDATSGQA